MRAGFSRVDITCPPGTPLGGNARAEKAARGVHDPLYASVAAFGADDGDDGPRDVELVLVSLDLLCAPDSLVMRLRATIAEVVGVAGDRVMVNATHTHSGPDVAHGSGFDLHDYSAVEGWLSGRLHAIAEAVADAVAVMRPARLILGRTDVGQVAFNRRLQMRDGSTHMNWEDVSPDDVERPLGPVDPQLLAMAWYDLQGKVLGVLVHFTLHPAVLVGLDWLVSADFPGPLVAEVRRGVGDVPVLFLNGALGNVNHIDYRVRGRATGFAEARRIGDRLGLATLAALSDGDSCTAQDVRVTSFAVRLEQRTADAAQVRQAHALLQTIGDTPVSALDGIPPEAYARWLVTRGCDLPPTLDVTVAIVVLGPLTLVLVPFEVFVEHQLHLASCFPAALVKIVSLANGAHGYLPTALSFGEGGYEPTFGTSVITEGQGEYLLECVREYLEQDAGPADPQRAAVGGTGPSRPGHPGDGG